MQVWLLVAYLVVAVCSLPARASPAGKKPTLDLNPWTTGATWVPVPECRDMAPEEMVRRTWEPEASGEVVPLHWGWTGHEIARMPNGNVIQVAHVDSVQQAYSMSPSYGVAYVHIHKCAGATFRFGSMSYVEDWKAFGLHQMPLDTILHTLSQLPIIFTYVRNPWSRMVSVYFFAGSRLTARPFVDFVTDPLIMRDLSIMSPIHYRPQVYSLVDISGRVVPDFIGRLEYIEHDFPVLLRAIGNSELTSKIEQEGLGKGHASKGDKQKTRPEDWRHMYQTAKGEWDLNLINQVRCHFEVDISMLGYAFDFGVTETLVPAAELMAQHFHGDRDPTARATYTEFIRSSTGQTGNPEAFQTFYEQTNSKDLKKRRVALRMVPDKA